MGSLEQVSPAMNPHFEHVPKCQDCYNSDKHKLKKNKIEVSNDDRSAAVSIQIVFFFICLQTNILQY